MFGTYKGQATSALRSAATEEISSPGRRKIIFYCLFFLILGGLVGFTAILARNNAQFALMVSMLAFVVVGILHLWMMNIYFPWSSDGKFNSKFWFTLFLAFCMAIGYGTTYFFLNRDYALLFPVSAVALQYPLLIHWAYYVAISIPPEKYKEWIYPDKPIVVDKDNIDLNNFALITFVFSKKSDESAHSNFQSRAPYQFLLGDLFYFFIEEWNHKNPGSTVEYLDEMNEPFGWHFYIKKTWWKPRQYLDPDLKIKDLNIKVNQIIKTERVKK